MKWVRAQLSFTQLSTYVVSYLEHLDLCAEVKKAWGDDFTPRKYHDMLLDRPIPE